MRYLLCFLLFFILGVNLSSGQDTGALNEENAQFWVDITFGKPLDEKWRVGGDAGFRSENSNIKSRTLYIRPNINYRFKPFFDISLGLGAFNEFNSEISNSFEFRIYQDANFKGPKLGPFNFKHRLRLEQRFIDFSADELDDTFSFRGRYMIGTRTDSFGLGGEKDWTVFVSLEPFFPLGSGVNEIVANNFRWDTALSYQVSEGLRIELHYVFQTSEIFSDNELQVKEHIFRFRVFQNL